MYAQAEVPKLLYRFLRLLTTQQRDFYALSEKWKNEVRQMDQVFPHQVNGRSMHQSWEHCRGSVSRVDILVNRFRVLQNKFPGDFKAPPELLKILKSCEWCQFEIADYHKAITVTQTATEACHDEAQDSQIMAHFLTRLLLYL